MSVASSRPPDTARLPHLQQLARRADRRLLIGSGILAMAALVLALRGLGELRSDHVDGRETRE